MPNCTERKAPVFWHGSNNRFPYISTLASVALVIGGAVAVHSNGGNWSFLVGVGAVFIVVMLTLSGAKLEIRASGFDYRRFRKSRSADFDLIEKAYFEDVWMDSGEAGAWVAQFFVQLRNGEKSEVPIKLFPMKAVVLLFSELDKHGVPIVEPYENQDGIIA